MGRKEGRGTQKALQWHGEKEETQTAGEGEKGRGRLTRVKGKSFNKKNVEIRSG